MSTLAISKDPRSPLDASLFSSAASREDERRESFVAVLGRMSHGNGADEDPAALARRSAENFVSMTLVQPLLKQLRENNHAPPPFGPTDGEKKFQGLMDAELAQRIVKAAQFPLVDRIAGDLLKRRRSAAENTGGDGSTDASSPLSPIPAGQPPAANATELP